MNPVDPSESGVKEPATSYYASTTAESSRQPINVNYIKEGKRVSLSFPSLAPSPEIPQSEIENIKASISIHMFHFERATDKLVVKKIDRHRAINGNAHRTFYYHLMLASKRQELVVRRGQAIRLTLTLNRPYAENDTIFFEFSLLDVERPQFAEGSLARFKLENIPEFVHPIADNRWYAICDSIADSGTAIKVQVRPAEKTPIGHWGMRVLTMSEFYASATKRKNLIFIIANPWEKDFIGPNDSQAESKRKEFVLADSGLVLTGHFDRPIPIAWRFAQFDKGILESAISLLRGCNSFERSHLFKVVRHISYMLDPTKGVIFEKKKPVFHWSDSKNILLSFAKSKKPVPGSRLNYMAPCVFVTVCRALGIPSRLVTFYNVLPENDGGLGIDRHYHQLGLLLHNLNPFNMWCYKVIPEVMLHRLDLPNPFGAFGWQAVTYHGPVSSGAIKAAPIYRKKPYGTDLIYRMIRSNYLHIKVEDPEKPVKVDLGKIAPARVSIMTKSVGSWSIDEITNTYLEAKKSEECALNSDDIKSANITTCLLPIPEGYNGGERKCHSVSCRAVDQLIKQAPQKVSTGVLLIDVLKANNGCISGFYSNDVGNINSSLATSCWWWGDPITISLFAKNKSAVHRKSLFSVEIDSVSPEGQLIACIKAVQNLHILKPNAVEGLNLNIPFEEYSSIASMKPGQFIRVNANVHVDEEDYDEYHEKFVGCLPLRVELKILNSDNDCQVSFSNLTDTTMKKCNLSIGEVGNKHRTTIFGGKTLGANCGMQATVNFVVKHPGNYFVEAKGSCAGDFVTSTYSALCFSPNQILIPNVPSQSFTPI